MLAISYSFTHAKLGQDDFFETMIKAIAFFFPILLCLVITFKCHGSLSVVGDLKFLHSPVCIFSQIQALDESLGF